MVAQQNRSPLSEADQRFLAAWLQDFERGWSEGKLAASLARLPPPLRLPALLLAVPIDLARHWARGRQALLEQYLKSYPELGTPQTVPVELVKAELEQRLRSGASVDIAEFSRRFPHSTDAVRQVIHGRSAISTHQPHSGRTTASLPAGVASGSPIPASLDDLPEQFGRYRILKRIGRGGMGSVYLAHDAELDRRVALKVPSFASHENSEIYQRFQREARAAATIEHPNICPIYDVGTINGIPYVTMAYIEGRSLAELIKNQQHLPARPVAAVVRKLALAMHAAHARGVVHRDLKPANVMINKHHEPIVMDFGLARRSTVDARLTVSGAILGTPAYMSPEQARGEDSAQSSDIYSLGVILYEMLTGRVPFTGDVHSVLAQILTQPPEQPTAVAAQADPALSEICLKAMAKQPGQRYRSMEQLAAALQGYLKGERPREKAPDTGEAPLPPPLPGELGGGDGQGLATQLLAKLDERFESHATAAVAREKPRTAHWIMAIAGTLGLIVLVFAVAAALNRSPQVDVKSTVVVELRNVAPEVTDPIVMTVMLDGNEIAPKQLDQPLRLAPGQHRLELTRRDGKVITKEFQVAHAATQAGPPEGSPIASKEVPKSNAVPPRKASSSGKRPSELTLEEKAAFADSVQWDLRGVQQHFKIVERTYDAERDQLLWLLEARAPTNFRYVSPLVAKYYDSQEVKVYENYLQLQPTRAEAAGERVRALLPLPYYRPNDLQDPRTTTVKVVIISLEE